MSANDICDIKVVGQHDGGSEFILSGKTLSQNEGEVVDFTPIEHFLAKIAKTGPYWGLTVPPPRRSVAVDQLLYHLCQVLFNKNILFWPLPWN